MELFSQDFKKAVSLAMESGECVLAVIHEKTNERLIVELRQRKDAELFYVDANNRQSLPEKLVKAVLSSQQVT